MKRRVRPIDPVSDDVPEALRIFHAADWPGAGDWIDAATRWFTARREWFQQHPHVRRVPCAAEHRPDGER